MAAFFTSILRWVMHTYLVFVGSADCQYKSFLAASFLDAKERAAAMLHRKLDDVLVFQAI